MDAAHQWHEGLSVIGILFADSVPEGEAVWMIECGAMVVSFAERVLMQPLPDASAKQRLGLKLSRCCPSQLDFICFARQNRNSGRAVTMEHEHAKGFTDGFTHKLYRAEYDLFLLRPTPMAELFCSCNNNHA